MHQSLLDLRQSLPVVEQCTYLQTGSLGPLSRPVLRALFDAEELAASAGPAAPDGLTPLIQAADEARTRLAALLHAPVDEIAWSANTSTAMRTVMQSLHLTAADRLITCDQEHVATRSLYNGLHDQLGLSVTVVSTAGDDSDFLTRLERILQRPTNGRTLLLLSHVSCIDGRILPAVDAAALARCYNAISLIDGAQAAGQIPVNVATIAADFYIGSCHKWLLGPSGVAFIYVCAERLADFNPNWLPLAEQANTAARRGEVGTTNLAQRAATGVALAQMQAIGIEAVAAHCGAVADHLRAGLRRFSRVHLLGPDDPAHTTGLVGFTVQDWGADECKALVDRLYRQRRILIKYQPEQTGLRVSIAAFNTVEEVDRLLHALVEEIGN